MNKDFTILDTKEDLISTVAKRCLATITSLLEESSDTIHIGLTGGSVGVGIMQALASLDLNKASANARIHYWLSDERWLKTGDTERNDLQLTQAFFEPLGISEKHIHRYLYKNSETSVAEAATQYLHEWQDHGSPAMDVLMLGVGPDGHVASLFPGNEALGNSETTILPVYDSPKPPPERISFSMELINQSHRIWLSFAGADKAEVFHILKSGNTNTPLPVTQVKGKRETHIFVDYEATSR